MVSSRVSSMPCDSMRFVFVFTLAIGLAVGCSKQKSAEEPADHGKGLGGAPAETVEEARTRLLNQLKSSNDKTRLDAVEQLSIWAETDPPTVDALIALLADKTTAGSGKTHPSRITSTREAAARALTLAGPKGERALTNRGLGALRDGLSDPQPTIREHTVFTIGLIGSVARPLSGDVMKLCTDSDPNVRGIAFDALRSIGITDVPGFVVLLNHDNAEIGHLAAELVPALPDVPHAAIPPLITALKHKSEPIRVAAAGGLALTGSRAAPAAGMLAEAIKASYPAAFDSEAIVVLGPEMAYWRALAKIGEPAAGPTADLLVHSNALVRGLAARTLGEIGPAAKTAAGKLKDALNDRYGFVAVESACALCRLGDGTGEAVELVRRALDAPNNVAQTAIEAIPRMGDAAKPLVATALTKLRSENPYARYAAIDLVGTLPSDEAMKHAAELGKLTADDLPEIRQRAALVLEKLGPAASPAAETLAKNLSTESDDSLRDRFVDALIAMGTGAKPALAALSPLAKDTSLPVSRRERVIAALAAADPSSAEVAKCLVAVAGDSDHSVRAAAATALGRLDPIPPDALAKLVALATADKRTDPRAAALRALAVAGPRALAARSAIGPIASGQVQDGLALLAKIAIAAMDGDPAKATAAVRAGLVDKKPDVRAAAARALLELGPIPEDLPALARLLKDRDEAVREAAVRSLGKLGPAAKETVPQLVKLLTNDGLSQVRIAAAVALGEIGPDALSAVAKLQQAVRDDRVVEPAAKKALEKLGIRDKK
jgi:HEAT repeat protein